MSQFIPYAFPSDASRESRGMTLRDYFAAAVLPVCTKQFYKERELYSRLEVAQDAYLIADCMLKARDQE